MKIKFSRQKRSQISNFIKIRPVGAEFLHADMKLIVAFRNFANMPKKVRATIRLQHSAREHSWGKMYACCKNVWFHPFSLQRKRRIYISHQLSNTLTAVSMFVCTEENSPTCVRKIIIWQPCRINTEFGMCVCNWVWPRSLKTRCPTLDFVCSAGEKNKY